MFLVMASEENIFRWPPWNSTVWNAQSTRWRAACNESRSIRKQLTGPVTPYKERSGLFCSRCRRNDEPAVVGGKRQTRGSAVLIHNRDDIGFVAIASAKSYWGTCARRELCCFLCRGEISDTIPQLSGSNSSEVDGTNRIRPKREAK